MTTNLFRCKQDFSNLLLYICSNYKQYCLKNNFVCVYFDIIKNIVTNY